MRFERFIPATHEPRWRELCSSSEYLDRYCSGPDWGISLCAAFQYDGELCCYTTDDGKNMAIFWERDVEGGRVLLPPDGMWLLGCPLLGPEPTRLLKELLTFWSRNRLGHGLRQVLISGLYPQSSLLQLRFWERLAGWEIESSERMAASLEGGFEGFMGRRSKNFRSRLRRTVKKIAAEDIEVEMMPSRLDKTEALALMERVFSIEGTSWKGLANRGINEGSMQEFYREMVPRLAADGRLRGLFLTEDGQDVAYLFGGIFSGYFRGLQFSFRDDRQVGLGNVCQYHMIKSLCEEGFHTYDLGQGMAYKKRWSEQHIESRSFIFQVP